MTPRFQAEIVRQRTELGRLGDLAESLERRGQEEVASLTNETERLQGELANEAAEKAHLEVMVLKLTEEVSRVSEAEGVGREREEQQVTSLGHEVMSRILKSNRIKFWHSRTDSIYGPKKEVEQVLSLT